MNSAVYQNYNFSVQFCCTIMNSLLWCSTNMNRTKDKG